MEDFSKELNEIIRKNFIENTISSVAINPNTETGKLSIAYDAPSHVNGCIATSSTAIRSSIDDILERINETPEEKEERLKEEERKAADAAANERRRRIGGFRVLVKDPAVIMTDSKGKKYVSVATGENFDAEKGLMLCLLKAAGYKYSDVEYMLEQVAKEEKKKIKAKEDAEKKKAANIEKEKKAREYKKNKKSHCCFCKTCYEQENK